jgi:mevalonate kinase
MSQEFYSNGKLLLSGEYAVLDGALAWAIPTKFGQFLSVSNTETKHIYWRSLDETNRVWFEATYEIETFKEISSTDQDVSKALQNILIQARQLNLSFLKEELGYRIETRLTFSRNWGLGSSSTLINNIAEWAKVDAYKLLKKTFGGSGYDIACAKTEAPILYQLINEKPNLKIVDQKPSFADQIYFVFLNKKKNSREAITAYRERDFDKQKLVTQITQLTREMVASTSLQEFEDLIVAHESLLSTTLGIATVKSQLFSDYTGVVKSLGGWGGDFVLATGDAATPYYFKDKGYPIVISFEEMIL